MSGAGEGNRTLLPSVSFRRKACRYAVFVLSRLLVSAQFGTVFSTLIDTSAYDPRLANVAGEE